MWTAKKVDPAGNVYSIYDSNDKMICTGLDMHQALAIETQANEELAAPAKEVVL